MKNYEKYADEIKEYNGDRFCKDFIAQHILKSDDCNNVGCTKCKMLQMLWLMEEYEEPKEPEVDWSKVAVDTPILVRQGKNGTWLERHFAKYENGDVYAWVDGQTSWTGADKIKWKHAKLAEGEKECKEPEVDWSKVNVDTPILVGEGDGDWVKRYFAEYKDGIVYAWCGGSTSWDANNMMMSWKYAKLVEDEKEPEADWSKVEVDTPILVRNDGGKWYTRHFAKYEDGIVYAWKSGRTSLTEDCMIEWAYAKLIENEEEPKTDWSEVEVDTPILVRNSEYGEWFKRHFAEYKNGKVYTWDNGYTSWTACGYMGAWNYAKLAENEE